MKHNTYLQCMTIIILCAAMILAEGLSYPLAAVSFEIQHEPVICAVTGSAVEIRADIIAEPLPQEVRVYFKKQGARHFYFLPMLSEKEGTYAGILPAPAEKTAGVEYLILAIAEDGSAMKSPTFLMVTGQQELCPDAQSVTPPSPQIIYTEQELVPADGFVREHFSWDVANAAQPQYLDSAKEIPVQTALKTVAIQGKRSKSSLFGKKTMIGLGAGLGAAAVIGVAVGSGGSGGGGNGDGWATSTGNVSSNIVATLNKTPTIQTSCGTIVTNQLFVTNNGSQEVVLGTIDYEVALAKDDPAGSCEPGRTGAFASDLALTVRPGATVLVREWTNEVNPCSACPYLIAECQWRSRYVVHTSDGSAVAEATFVAQGDLCGTSASKPAIGRTRIRGDIEP